jgi:hypothetical protein
LAVSSFPDQAELERLPEEKSKGWSFLACLLLSAMMLVLLLVFSHLTVEITGYEKLEAVTSTFSGTRFYLGFPWGFGLANK